MTLFEYYMVTDFGNRIIHFRGRKGQWYRDHILDLFNAYKDERIKEIKETDTDVYIELYTREELINGNDI